MTKQYDNTNRGVMFRNKRKTADTHADFTGTQDVDGTEMWLNMWERRTKDGDVYYVTSVRPKEARAEPSERPAATRETDSDVIPF